MSGNCGCGGNSHSRSLSHKEACPPMMACDVAKTHAEFCGTPTTSGVGGQEINRLIADVTIPTFLEADISLPSAAFDVKNIRKNVQITQCKAIPVLPPGGTAVPTPTTTTAVDLFIEGFVHKNIQFAEGCDGYVRDHSVNVPFRCYQRVMNVGPVNVRGLSQKSSNVQEFRESSADGMGSNRCGFGSRHFEFFNEPINCRILDATIEEFDMARDFDRWGNFKELTEKLSLTFTVRLTQLQFRALT